ncbi:hypothetical protein K0U73_17750 [bacterium]|nr:hypothetical protein [bacterium]MDB2392583.1 hypothetical protein [Acidimicrobiaceae bacterium]MDC0349721.1 hypothetical protein [bacterium]
MRPPTRRAAVAAFSLALAATSCSGASTDTVVASVLDQAVEVAPEAVVEPPQTTVPVQGSSTNDPAADDSEPAIAAATQETPRPADTEPADAAPGSPATSPAAVAIQLPDVSVVDLSTGETADLEQFVRPGPTLVWFWAPH